MQMYLSGCKVDEKLIDNLFKLQKTDKSSKIVPKLSVTYKKPGENRKVIISGGCDLTINKELRHKIEKILK